MCTCVSVHAFQTPFIKHYYGFSQTGHSGYVLNYKKRMTLSALIFLCALDLLFAGSFWVGRFCLLFVIFLLISLLTVSKTAILQTHSCSLTL